MLSEKKERVLKLAEKYGPFVRFLPEGSEDSNDENTLNKTIKQAEKETRTPDEQSAIDKARLSEQQLEQEKANTSRANEAAREAQSDLETANSENETLKEQLATAEAKATEAGIKNVELNEDDYEANSDKALVRAIKNVEEKIDAKDKKIASLEKKASGYEDRDRKKQVESARSTAYEELLTELDGDYGADCRNDAVKKFNELCRSGGVPKGDTARATRVLERCYKEVKEAKPKGKKTPISLDSGAGGGSAPNLAGADIKSGSLDEVAEQYGKALAAQKS